MNLARLELFIFWGPHPGTSLVPPKRSILKAFGRHDQVNTISINYRRLREVQAKRPADHSFAALKNQRMLALRCNVSALSRLILNSATKLVYIYYYQFASLRS
jgi:hypothetical protein